MFSMKRKRDLQYDQHDICMCFVLYIHHNSWVDFHDIFTQIIQGYFNSEEYG